MNKMIWLVKRLRKRGENNVERLPGGLRRSGIGNDGEH